MSSNDEVVLKGIGHNYNIKLVKIKKYINNVFGTYSKYIDTQHVYIH